eukprot:3873601-Lingulodinium_polyedra.AAC.1
MPPPDPHAPAGGGPAPRAVEPSEEAAVAPHPDDPSAASAIADQGWSNSDHEKLLESIDAVIAGIQSPFDEIVPLDTPFAPVFQRNELYLGLSRRA